MKTYIQITQTEAAKRVQRGGFTLVQENLQTEVIYSQEEYEEEEEWNIHEEVSITEAVYEEGTFRNSMYNKSKTTNYAKSTIESPHLKHRPSKMRKSDRHVPDPNPTTPKLALPQGEGSSYKDSSSKRVTSTAKEHIKFETQTHEEVGVKKDSRVQRCWRRKRFRRKKAADGLLAARLIPKTEYHRQAHVVCHAPQPCRGHLR